MTATAHPPERTAKPLGILLLVSLLLFIPFSGKPLHIDSPVTVYIAEQLLENPLNPPAGNFGPLLWPWNHTELPESSAFRATPHPPLLSYWLALVIKLFGVNERVVNWAFFPFYAGAILFFYLLCRVVALRSALLCALLYAVAPVVYVNAQNVMYDLPLGMFCTAVFYYLFKSFRWQDVTIAAVFAGAACLIKFTAGTLVIAGVVYFVMQKRWKHALVFMAVASFFNFVWMVHNELFLGNWQLTGNGHAHYLLGDIRYRLERMVSFIGALIVFPLFPLVVWWRTRVLRSIGMIIGAGAAVWAALLVVKLDYSWSSAAIYACCAAAGGMFILLLKELTVKDDASPDAMSRPKGVALGLHALMQMVGGLFLTLYASRYALTFVFIALLAFALSVQRHFSIVAERRLYVAALCISLTIAVMLSISDFQIVQAEKRCAAAVKKQFPETALFFKGRLGYLYYMHNAGAHSLTDARLTPKTGDIVVRNGFYPRDDADFFAVHKEDLQMFDSLCYPLFPLRTIGGRAGFYGNDRLPFAWVQQPSYRAFYLYRVR